jgi:hypothetical protein
MGSSQDAGAICLNESAHSVVAAHLIVLESTALTAGNGDGVDPNTLIDWSKSFVWNVL